jgi:hypothetical protein
MGSTAPFTGENKYLSKTISNVYWRNKKGQLEGVKLTFERKNIIQLNYRLKLAKLKNLYVSNIFQIWRRGLAENRF